MLERLTAKEMPPKVTKQPPAEARQQVIDWIQAVRDRARRERTPAIPGSCWRAA